jgi:uncharacterized heparinase superfamily protein
MGRIAQKIAERLDVAANARAVRAARRAPAARGFQSHPEPRTIGMFARGKQIAAGNFLLAGHLVETGGESPFAQPAPSVAFADELHGFAWLDHLAAVGDARARRAAQDWLSDWIARCGPVNGPGWQPHTTGRRVVRWINHALFLMTARDGAEQAPFFDSLGAQMAYLARRWNSAPAGLPRAEALSGLLYGSLALIGMEGHLPVALAGLAALAQEDIAPDGGIPSRNPDELLGVFTALNWAVLALVESGRPVPPALLDARDRIGPGLRGLRHADGTLARFHGGGRGAEGWLDHALAQAAIPPGLKSSQVMGFQRLDGGRTSVVVDAAPPPRGDAARRAHASTLGFELVSNRRALIVSCGSGVPFGPDWERAGRATQSHSTLAIDGFSSARFGTPAQADDGRAPLTDGPRKVTVHRTEERHATSVLMSHDGWLETHGLTHIRNLDLSADGRALLGEDTLAALDPADRRRFSLVVERTQLRGLRFALHFHLHPECDPSLDMGGRAVSIALRSGEIWVFRFEGTGALTLEPSVYLEKGRLQPRPTQQIVLRGLMLDFTAQINWTLAKAQDTPLAVRDIGRDDDLALPKDMLPI